jgi:hypothetical protein
MTTKNIAQAGGLGGVRATGRRFMSNPYACNYTPSGDLCQILSLVRQAIARAYHALGAGAPGLAVKHLLVGIAMADLALRKLAGVRNGRQ